VSRLYTALARLPLPVRRALKRLPGYNRARAGALGAPSLPAPPPGSLRPVVYLPTWLRWDVMRQRPQYVLQDFVDRGHPVYFVDPREPTERVAGGVVITPSVAGTPADGVILYVHFAPAMGAAPGYRDPVVYYDITDDLTAFADVEGEDPPRFVLDAHRSLIESADVVSAAGRGLAAHYRKERGDLITALNGVDTARFASPMSRPSDMPGADPDHPVAGYHGALAAWRFDFDLFAATAASLPEWRFVVIGPVDTRVADAAARIEALPNVTLLGEKHADELPAYVRAFDVGTMWYPLNEVTAKALPMKLNEYLAAGVPAVATSLPSMVDHPAVRLADDPAGFAAAIQAARADAADPQWRRMAQDAVAGADWSQRLQPVMDRLDELTLRTVP